MLKIIVSQDDNQIFTCGQCQIYSLSTVELPPDKKSEAKGTTLKYSVGVAGISFGQFAEKDKAKKVLYEIAAFLSSNDTVYTIPLDEDFG